MSDGQQQRQQDSGQSSKATAISPPHEPKSLPPIKHLPLRKRLAMEASIKITPKVSPKEEPLATPTTAEEEYPPTPGSQHSASSSGGSSDSTIPIIHSPPPQPPPPIQQKNEKVVKQPLKKAYHWTKGKTNTNNTTSKSTLENTTSNVNRNKLIFNNGGLPGNPLLWNNGDAEKYAPWTSAEDTIKSFKSAWLGEDETDDSDEIKEEKGPVIEHKTVAIKKSNSLSAKRGRPATVTRKSNDTSEAPVTKVRKNSGRATTEGKLYCVCRQPYDATRFMIACDRCDDWFHGECIGINEKESEFVDLYFCTKCSKLTGKKSSWKPKCANPACHKAARIGSQLGHLSKYCSDSCGMQVARARLELVEIKRRNNSQNNNNNNNNTIPIAQLALMKQRQLRINSFANKQDKKRLIQIRLEMLKIRDNLQGIDKKIAFLNELKLLHPIQEQQNEGEEDVPVEGPCGFDSRLILDDKFWKENGDLESQEFKKCQVEKCERHVQWQKLLSLEFKQERKEQFQHLATLEKERNQVKERMRWRRSEKDMIKDLINGTISV